MPKPLTLCRNFCNCAAHLTCVRALSFDQRKWDWKNFEPKAGKACVGYIAEGKEPEPNPLPLLDHA
jgi:hypothetical protein